MVGILTLDTEEISDPSVYQRYYDEMPPLRKEKIEKYHFYEDRLRSLGAGVLLKRALLEAGFEGKDQEYTYDEAGKPMIPSIDTHFKFSISHSGTQVMCVYAFDPEGEAPCVGCDTEKIGQADFRIAERFFTQEENRMIRGKRKEETKNRMFYRLWTLKESFLKATGKGMALSLSEFSIRISSDGEIGVRQQADGKNYRFKEEKFRDDYCYAWCIAEEILK